MTQTRADLVGKRFGTLTVVEFSHLDKYHHAHWKCDCDCGGKKTAPSRQLLGGRVKSCGCYPCPVGSKNKQWKGCGELSLCQFTKIRKDALRRSLPFEITIEQCWDLFLKQNRRCKLSNLPIKFRSKIKVHDGTASLDRIDSSKGYTPDNIQWVHRDVNTMKWDFTTERFLFLVRTINEVMKNFGVLV